MSTGWGPPSVPPPQPGAPGPGQHGAPPAWTPPPTPAAGAWGAPTAPTAPTAPPSTPPTSSPPPSSPRRVRTGLVALLAVALLAGAAAIAWIATTRPDGPGEGWTRHELAGGAVSVELPGPVERESGTVWSGSAGLTGSVGLTGSAVWTGDGGLDRVSPGVVVIEGDAAQLGLSATAVEALAPALFDQALDTFVAETGAVEVEPSGLDDGATPDRQVEAADGTERVVLGGASLTDGTRVVGIIVTVPVGEEVTLDPLLDRVLASVEFDS